MVFQYQYQYQYQLQRGLGIATYETFSQLLRDAYSNPLILAFIVALAPLLLISLFNRIAETNAYIHLRRIYLRRKEERHYKKARDEFVDSFLGKKRRDMVAVLFLAVIITVGGLIFTKSLFLVAVTSNSMAPTFWETDLILVQSIAEDYQKGDIAVFQDPRVSEINVIHRIESVEGNKIRTRGDNNNNIDDWVLDRTDIMGIAVTLDDKPITLKKAGRYFIKGLDPTLESDPTFLSIRKAMDTIRSNGPLYLVIILLLLFLTQMQGAEKSKLY